MKKRIWALVTGTIRGDLYFRIVIIKLCDLRHRGLVEKIIYSTWEGEIDKFPGLRKELNELGVILVESPYIDEVNEGKYHGQAFVGYARQREVLAMGIKIIPNDVFVLKLRTDGDRWIDRIFKIIEEDMDLSTQRYGSFPIIYDAKLAINFINFRHMLYGYDQYYLASKETINKLTLSIPDKKTRKFVLCTETRTLCGYAYVFYELLREIWDIIPGNFYDQLWAYCRKKQEKDLVLPRLVHRIFATVCVYIYTQLNLAGEDKKTDVPVKLIDLFSDRIRTNSQIEKIVFGNLVDSQLSYVFKDELRKVSLYSSEVRSYTYEEYVELKEFCEKELHKKNLIGAYPYIGAERSDCDIYFISEEEDDSLDIKPEKTLQVQLLSKSTNYNYFRYNLAANKRYTIRIKGINSTAREYTAGIFEFNKNRKIRYKEYDVSKESCFNFTTGENIGQAAFLIYAGVHGKTSGEELSVSAFEVASEDLNIDKKKAGRIMLKKYKDDSCGDKLVEFIKDDFDFDGWKLYLATKLFFDENNIYNNEILKMSTYDRNPAALSEYAARLKSKPEFYDHETFAHNYKFLNSIFNMGLKAGLIIAIYNYLLNYHTFLSIHGMGTRNLMLSALNRLFTMLEGKEIKLAEVIDAHEFLTLLIGILYKSVNEEKLTPARIATIEAVLSIATNNPFSDELLKRLKEDGREELIAKIINKWPKEKFSPKEWIVSEELKEVLASEDIGRIIEYTARIKGRADAQELLKYFSYTYFDMPIEEQKKAYESIEKLSRFFVDVPFFIKAIRFMQAGNMTLVPADMADRKNYIILIELLYKRKAVIAQCGTLEKMCFKDAWREVILHTFKRLERDNKLTFFSMKNDTEIWFHYVPYLQNKNCQSLEVNTDENGHLWPFLKRDNISSFAGLLRLREQGLFISVELSAKDKLKSHELAKKAGFDIKGQSGNLLRLHTHQIDFNSHEEIEKAVNLALDEFCQVGEKLVAAMG